MPVVSSHNSALMLDLSFACGTNSLGFAFESENRIRLLKDESANFRLWMEVLGLPRFEVAICEYSGHEGTCLSLMTSHT